MISVSTKQDFVAHPVAAPSQHFQRPFRLASQQVSSQPAREEMPRPNSTADASNIDVQDVACLVLICSLAGSVLFTSVGIARPFVDELGRLSSFDLMRAFGGF